MTDENSPWPILRGCGGGAAAWMPRPFFHLQKSQWAMIGANMESYREKAKERQKVRKGNQPGATVEQLPQLDSGKARDQIGEVVGVSGRMIDKAVQVSDGCKRRAYAIKPGKKLSPVKVSDGCKRRAYATEKPTIGWRAR
ncbi:MAG: hypothetical protein IT426_07155 [Pirellulales bacterium]|nr:hypothetical protein [Pirellulales bacterium]